MYEAFFGLRERPFDLAPDPRFLFLSAPQREALSMLRYGLTTPRGLTLLLGDAGTGKTTLVRTVLSEIGNSNIECLLLDNPTLTRGEFYEFLADGFRLRGGEASRSKTWFLRAVRLHLEERHAEGQLTAVVLDEAQSLPYELLEEVRLLSNLETATTKLLNVVLAGQQELAERLNEPGLRQLKQRISLRCELTPFDAAGTKAYVAGRLRIAGGSPAGIFTSEAVEAVYAASGGVPRVINVICDNALISGFAVQAKPVPRELVEEAIRDLDLSHAPAPLAPAPRAALGSVDVIATAGAAPDPTASGRQRDRADESELFALFGRRRRFSFF